MTQILIADRTHPVLEERLRAVGFDVRVEPDHDYESLLQAVQGCDGLVVRSKVIIDKEFIDRALGSAPCQKEGKPSHLGSSPCKGEGDNSHLGSSPCKGEGNLSHFGSSPCKGEGDLSHFGSSPCKGEGDLSHFGSSPCKGEGDLSHFGSSPCKGEGDPKGGGVLRCIGRVGAGMETIDVEYAERKGIRCLNSPEGNRDAVGEHTVGLLLALLNNIARADAEVRRGLWRREANRGLELSSLTVGIIGFGNMGQAFAKRLSGFGCRVIFYDKYLDNLVNLDNLERVSLETLQREADVVSFHVPLTGETHHYLDSAFIGAMRKPFFFLNTSRGAVVDTAALAEGLKSGKVRGAALDVLEYENMQADTLADIPEPMRYLMESPQTVLTPHVAGWTVESKYKLAAVLADKIIDVLK